MIEQIATSLGSRSGWIAADIAMLVHLSIAGTSSFIPAKKNKRLHLDKHIKLHLN